MQLRALLLALVAASVALAGCNTQTPSGTGEDDQTPTDEDQITGGDGNVPQGGEDAGTGSQDTQPGQRDSTRSTVPLLT